MPSAHASSGFYGGCLEVSEFKLLKQKQRDRHKRKRRAVRRARKAALTAASILFVSIFVKGSVVEAFYVPSGSMNPTIRQQDYILVEKLRYGLRVPLVGSTVVPWGMPKRGDIVVFRRSDDPTTSADESGEDLVKRVIGVEGDIVEISGNKVAVNGTELYEPYAKWGEPQGVPLTVAVPHGALFVLGDNRSNSFDSRFWSDPFVAREQVVGKATLAYAMRSPGDVLPRLTR